MSPKYQILDNRPIHQWKVTELRDELKRRKLSTKGLKDDLVKRLDEALRIEREADEASEKDEANGFDGHVDREKDSEVVTVDAEMVNPTDRESAKTFEAAEKGNSGVVEPIEMENVEKILEVVDHDSNKNEKQDGVSVQVDINSVSAMDQDVEHKDLPACGDSANVGEEAIAHASTVETTVTVTESVPTEVVASGEDSHSAENNNEDSAAKLENNEESKAQLDDEDTKPQLDCDTKPLHEDPVPDSSVPENQVSEVNPSLGSQVKSDSISTDSVSINQKNELKDTIITDNVKLEQDIVKPEMVEEPSSRNDVPVYDESHSMDVGGLHEKKASVEENINNVSSPDLNKTNSSDDVGYAEKLNLDRSSGDDSMEEDLPETKQIDSKFNVDELRDKVESTEGHIVKEENSTIVVGDSPSAGKIDIHQDTDISPVAVAEKRNFMNKHQLGTMSLQKGNAGGTLKQLKVQINKALLPDLLLHLGMNQLL
ncbi:Apoptotic chromatin condensation inducer [Spatholobus suberectus]|nr:Apoptotic chromatin condensation inducer [Spatholobus suberectus]